MARSWLRTSTWTLVSFNLEPRVLILLSATTDFLSGVLHRNNRWSGDSSVGGNVLTSSPALKAGSWLSPDDTPRHGLYSSV